MDPFFVAVPPESNVRYDTVLQQWVRCSGVTDTQAKQRIELALIKISAAGVDPAIPKTATKNE